MTDVLDFIESNEPVELEAVVEEYGNHGVRKVHDLMEENKVSFNIEWQLATH
jgi:hypothetical protein